MRTISLLFGVALLAACSKSEQTPGADSAAAATAAVTTPAPITLAAVAGKWTVEGRRASDDSLLVSYELSATSDTTGWTLTLPGNRVVPIQVWTVAGDSIVLHAGPFESVLRKGVQVTTHSVMRMDGARLVGTTVSRYNVTTADSVLSIRTIGTRMP